MIGYPILSIRNITKSFNGKEILQGVSLDFNQGEIFGIIGPSGSGKTVLFKTIAGFYKQDQGELKFNHDTNQIAQQLIGFSTQTQKFYSGLTPIENMQYFGTMYNLTGKEIKTRTQGLLKLVSLDYAQDKKSGELSGGMQRRLDLALALIHNPPILLLDEPTSGLDPILRTQILELIQRIRQQGTTIIIASHFVDEIEPICDRIGIMKDGRIIALGKPVEIRNRNANIHKIKLRTYPGNYSTIISKLIKTFNILEYQIKEGELHFIVSQVTDTKYYLDSISTQIETLNEKLITISIDKSPFEEVFEEIIKNVD